MNGAHGADELKKRVELLNLQEPRRLQIILHQGFGPHRTV
jgi:hypothetical protein